MKHLWILLLIFPFLSQAQNFELSSKASIQIITIGPYQGELYSAFGHSGIRVYDPKLRIDYFYNYGVFDFDQPNFYLNFTKGHLNYRLAVADYPRVKNHYAYQNRYVNEQVLNLTEDQKQKLFKFLQWNALPENMNYFYNYFYDNCATRVRDAVEKTFEDAVQFDGSYIDTDYTIRDLTDIYLQEQPWGDLGIDLGLGLPIDIKATPKMYMFLPDYIEKAFNHATILHGDEEVPLVLETNVAFKPTPQPSQKSLITPLTLFSLLALIVIGTTYLGYKKKKHLKWVDIILFSLIGILGWLLFLLWVATDHHDAAKNFNLLWSIPLYFPIAIWLIKKHVAQWLSKFFLITAIIHAITLLFWFIIPQQLHIALIPLVIILMIRSAYIYYFHKQKNEIT